jgi:hypothetical protein
MVLDVYPAAAGTVLTDTVFVFGGDAADSGGRNRNFRISSDSVALPRRNGIKTIYD